MLSVSWILSICSPWTDREPFFSLRPFVLFEETPFVEDDIFSREILHFLWCFSWAHSTQAFLSQILQLVFCVRCIPSSFSFKNPSLEATWAKKTRTKFLPSTKNNENTESTEKEQRKTRTGWVLNSLRSLANEEENSCRGKGIQRRKGKMKSIEEGRREDDEERDHFPSWRDKIPKDEVSNFISRFTSSLWKFHPPFHHTSYCLCFLWLFFRFGCSKRIEKAS